MSTSQSKVLKLRDAEFAFETFFNPITGEYLRTGLLDSAGQETGQEPFMASFPHLLDVGIMGHCNHGLSGKCTAVGNQCYQSGATKWQANMPLTDFKNIVDQSEGKVWQFALGGRGDPDQHEEIEKILSYSREHGIVPNLTTSGYELTSAKANLISKYCGAAAVSWYKTEYTQRAIDLLLATGIKVNLHFVLSRQSIDEAIEMIEHQQLPAQINRIIFLLFKPIGQGQQQDVLPFDQKTKYFFSLMDSAYGLQKMGFDSCSVPAVVNCTNIVDPNCYDACEAGRFSAYVTPDLQLLPCSFDQTQRWSVSLHNRSLQSAWRSPQFDDFRHQLEAACPQCARRELCLGGCPIEPSVTLCESKKEREVRFL